MQARDADAPAAVPRLAAALLVGLVTGALLALAGCRSKEKSIGIDASVETPPPWAAPDIEPDPRPGMVWIPPGVLIAGTPKDVVPRVADEEMAGEQVVLHGFYIDVYPYPNEAGAIPTTSITQDEARGFCEADKKRLCTELELERACKGPSNTVYEYGSVYKEQACVTGVARALVPNGMNANCQSAWGVHDLHGGIWSWTSSPWSRDRGSTRGGVVATRGGNGLHGELVARCANGRGAKPGDRREDLGVRCCAGDANEFEVALDVTRGEPLKWQRADHRAPALARLVPDEAIAADSRGLHALGSFKVDRMWTWHPLGNEELVIGGGCAHHGEHASCGVVIARMRLDGPVRLAFVPSDWWQPTLGEADSPREVFLYGGDRAGAFRRRVSYSWGTITVAEKERKKRHKGRHGVSY